MPSRRHLSFLDQRCNHRFGLGGPHLVGEGLVEAVRDLIEGIRESPAYTSNVIAAEACPTPASCHARGVRVTHGMIGAAR
jgi:hypothetical protein